MKIIYIWKLVRTTRRIRIRGPFVRHTPLSYRTCNFPPPFHQFENAKHREYFPGCFPPSPVSPIPALAHAWRRVLPCYILWCYCLLCYLFVSPSLLIFGRLRYCDKTPRPLMLRCSTTATLPKIPFVCRASRQAPPLITRYRLLFSLLLALE